MLLFVTIAACLLLPTEQVEEEVSCDVTSLLQSSVVHNGRSERSRGEQIPLQLTPNFGIPQAAQGFGMSPQQNFGMSPQQNFGMAPQQNFGMAPQQNFGMSPGNFGSTTQDVEQMFERTMKPQVEHGVDLVSPNQVNQIESLPDNGSDDEDGEDEDEDFFETDDEKSNSWNGICKVTWKDKQDCKKFTKSDRYKKLSTWNWQSRVCKIRVPPVYGTYADACLWQGCLVNKKLEQGAKWYMEFKGKGPQAYCFREHCGNTQFSLSSTTVEHAHTYCDQKFGDKWRNLTAGPHGLGWEDEGPGTGLWECAHHNYHCDWSYCKLNFCDEPELRQKFCTKEHPCAAYHGGM